MNNMNEEALTGIAMEALERTAFVLCEPCDDPDAVASPDRFVQIAYSGPENGTVVLCASDGFLAELASSILGEEPEEIDAATTGVEALKEMANVMCGSVVFELGGEENTISLGLPEAIDPADRPSGGMRVLLDSDGECLEIFWTPESGVSARAA